MQRRMVQIPGKRHRDPGMARRVQCRFFRKLPRIADKLKSERSCALTACRRCMRLSSSVQRRETWRDGIYG